MKISVISPSIRPDGLKVTFNTLKNQTFTEFEWLPRLSIPGERSDLCKQFNRALDEASGELIVFLQDYITINPDALQRMWDKYQQFPDVAWTAPVGKKDLDNPGNIKWDWRTYWEHRDEVPFDRWEIDWGSIPKAVLGTERFFERYDEGFGWENVDLAYVLSKKGVKFMVDRENPAVADDHDKFMEHPYKKRPNADLWIQRRGIIDLLYGESEARNMDSPRETEDHS